jgi:hypothetical protein
MIDEITSIETRAKTAGVRMGDVLRRAGLAYTTWTRWKHGADPQLSNLRKVEGALEAELVLKSSANGWRGAK